MTQMPPPVSGQPGGYGYVQPPRRANGSAIASLIFGILGCVPFLTGLLAVVLGIVGLRKTRDPSVGGKGMAIAGLVLGLISIVLWGLFGGGIYSAYFVSKPTRTAAHQFLADVSAGNTQSAVNESTLSATEIQEGTTQLQQFGQFQDTTFFGFNVATINGVTTATVGGTAKFSNGTKACTFELIKQDGTWKVKKYTVQ
jgi:hypothetical protein